jgi:hypothetical protein
MILEITKEKLLPDGEWVLLSLGLKTVLIEESSLN